MDDLDHAIVQQLQLDGRTAFTEIAQKLGVSEGTVRNRYTRLTEEGVLQVIGMINPHQMGIDAPALIGVTLESDHWDDAIKEIANFDEVSYLVLVSGEFDLIVEVMCQDRDHLADFLQRTLRQVPGVIRTQTFTILRTYKMALGAKPTLESWNEAS
ncbi:MAG: Lrp/AsnC family transcriptional regulator [Anaerolineales bacterium]|jgi:Lrp/AsnC family transcriptional regulator for asnA, asnC and gidA